MGEGEEEICDIIQIFFFITIQICLSWRVADGRGQVALG